jgi:hypothetical protein
MKQRVLEAGAGVAQSFTPLKQIHAHLCALHAYASQPQRQVVAHHYCTHLTSSIHQCVLYDSADANARVVGIEYLISRQLFDTLPEDEQRYWHSHQYEVEVTAPSSYTQHGSAMTLSLLARSEPLT